MGSSVGALRRINPIKYIENAVRLATALRGVGFALTGRTVFELGTGRTVNGPVAWWLAGAERIKTVDLNRYLREELCNESISWIRSHPEDVDIVFRPLAVGAVFKERLARIDAVSPGLRSLFALCGIDYCAPLDATKSGLPDAFCDVYVSTNVLEHVPPSVVRALFREARRILRPGGMMAHYIDLRDHFYTTDPSITMVNFLQFPESEWEFLAGNRFMYQNRLRVHEYQTIFDEVGFRPCVLEKETDARSLAALRSGMLVDYRFAGRSVEELATVGITVVGQFD